MKKKLLPRLCTVLGLLVLLAVSVYLAVRWHALPESVPLHYNAAGESDAFGRRASLLFPLLFGWLLFGMLSFFGWLAPLKSPQSPQAVQAAAAELCSVLKLLIALDFSYITIQAARGSDLGRWFLPVYFGLLFGAILLFVLKMLRAKRKIPPKQH